MTGIGQESCLLNRCNRLLWGKHDRNGEYTAQESDAVPAIGKFRDSHVIVQQQSVGRGIHITFQQTVKCVCGGTGVI